jgi:hypothetical protein
MSPLQMSHFLKCLLLLPACVSFSF